MLEFQPITIDKKPLLEPYLRSDTAKGCEYNFVNLFLWGRQAFTLCYGHAVIFSQYNRKSVYLFPVGDGVKCPVLSEIMRDAKERGIPCRITGLNNQDIDFLNTCYPEKFRFHFDRDSFDYVYRIEDLAELKGRKYQKKRNHLNRFRKERPNWQITPITEDTLPLARKLAADWYAARLAEDPHRDFHMEQAALKKALDHFSCLDLEGVFLTDGDQLLAMAIGSFLNDNTFDIHFEKALVANDGTYAAINQGFAQHLRQTHPQLTFLNREDDMGIEGLRKAKLSYLPDHMVEKSWAHLLEEGYEY